MRYQVYKAFIISATVLFATPAFSKGEMNATWYQCCKRTANGEKFDPDGMTAAHKTYPFGTMMRVTHKDKSVVVRINDRGPFRKGYQLDLSRGAAFVIGCRGLCRVKYEIISR